MNILEVKDLNINFGGITAVDNLNFFSEKRRDIRGYRSKWSW